MVAVFRQRVFAEVKARAKAAGVALINTAPACQVAQHIVAVEDLLYGELFHQLRVGAAAGTGEGAEGWRPAFLPVLMVGFFAMPGTFQSLDLHLSDRAVHDLIIYTAEPGTASEDRLKLLAIWTATQSRAAQPTRHSPQPGP